MNYRLEVIFRKKQTKILYQGISYLRKNLSDELLITDKMIRLEFKRTEKLDETKFLETPNSLIRYELQRALVFYLAVTGMFPPVSKVLLWKGETPYQIEHKHFTNTWRQCGIDICIPETVCGRIFANDEKAKHIYIAITYFLKAQLVLFSNDAFRSAWSGFNAIYRIFRSSDDEADKKQLKRFVKLLNKLTAKGAISEVKMLDREFWETLEWYQFVERNYDRSKWKFLQGNEYIDYIIIQPLLKLSLKKGFDDQHRIHHLENVIEKEHTDYLVRLQFLLCEYCYMLRNRSFHAAKAYPIFVIADDAETRNEKILTRIILLTIKDILMSDVI